MPEPLEREVIFDIAQALASLEELDRAFEESANRLRESLSTAASDALTGVAVDDVDASQVQGAIEGAVEEGAATEAVISGTDATNVETEVAAAVIEGADTPAVIEGDATDVGSAIDAAVTGADTSVEVTGEADQVTDAIDNAVSAADTDLVLTGDVSDIEAALDGLEGTEIGVALNVDTGTASEDLQEVTGAAENAGQSAVVAGGQFAALGLLTKGASGNVSVLKDGVGLLGSSFAKGAAAGAIFAAFVGETVGIAAKVETGIQRLNHAFGDFTEQVDTIDIKGFNGDIGEFGELLGSGGTNIRNAAATLGEFGNAAGAAQGEVAKTTQQVILLAGRAVALNPKLGDVGEVTDRLTKALASGRDKALVPFGIAVDKSAVAVEAQRRALERGSDTVSAYDKIAAAAALQTSDLGDKLGDDIVEGSKNAEIGFRRLGVEVRSALAEFGKPLVQPVLEAMENLVPVAGDLASILGVLAKAVMPLLVPATEAFAAGISFIADSIAAVPTPLLLVAGAILAIANAEAIATAATEAFGRAVAFSSGGIGLALIAITALGAAFNLFGGQQRDVQAEVNATSDALFGQAESAKELEGTFDDFAGTFDKFIEKTADFGDETDFINDSMDKLGLTNRDLQKTLTGSGDDVQALAERLVDASGEYDKFGLTAHEAVKLAAEGPSTKSVEEAADMVKKVAEEIEQERQNIEDASKAKLDDLVVTNELTDAQRDHLVALNTGKDGVVNYFKALEQGTTIAAANVQAQEASKVATLSTSEAFKELQQAIIAGQEVDVTTFAAQFGVSADLVQASVDELKASVDDFVSTGTSALPTAQDAFDTFSGNIKTAFDNVAKAAEEGKGGVEKAQDELLAAMSPQRLIEQLQKQQTAISNFGKNLKKLLSEGATDAVKFLISVGPEAGGGLAQSLVDQGPKVAGGVSKMLHATDQSFTDYQTFLQTEAYPAIADVNKDGMIDATEAANANFKPDPKPGMDAAQQAIEDGQPGVETAASNAATAGSVSFVEHFTPAPGTGRKTELIGPEIRKHAPVGPAKTAGGATSGALVGGYAPGSGVGQKTDALASLFSVNALIEVTGAAFGGGSVVGEAFGTGMDFGFVLARDDVTEGVRKLVAAAVAAGKDEAGVKSPSTVFMEIGEQMGAGLAIGIDKSTQAVARASENLVTAAASGFADLPAAQVAGPVITAGAAGNSSTVNNQFAFDVAVTVNGAMTTSEARRAADTFATEARAALLRRNVIASVRAV